MTPNKSTPALSKTDLFNMISSIELPIPPIDTRNKASGGDSSGVAGGGGSGRYQSHASLTLTLLPWPQLRAELLTPRGRRAAPRHQNLQRWR